MSTSVHFADVLRRYVDRTAYRPAQLAALSGLPKSTIVNWLRGRVNSPRDWQSLLKLLAVLHLDQAEAGELLQAAGHPPLHELKQIAAAADRHLLRAWDMPTPRDKPAPFQAIADLPYFVGRRAIAGRLTERLLRGDVCVLQGMAGVGKTALAARLAYDLRSHFSDGVLWARLQNSDSMTILSTFARAYGADASLYPDVDSRSRLVRQLLADRRVLLVLDDAPDSSSVEPLLPPTGHAAVLITTRRRNLNIAGRGHRFTLAPFSAESGASDQLFSHFLGDEAATQAQELAQIAERVGYLPLALSIIAGRLAFESGWSARALLHQLQQKPLQTLQSEDHSVRLSLTVSCEALTGEQRAFFAALSVFGSSDFSVSAAAAVTQRSAQEAQHFLRTLHSLSLLQEPSAGRYQLHPLLADEAASLAREERLDEEAARRRSTYFASLLKQRPEEALLEREYTHLLATLEHAWQREQSATLAELTLALLPFWQHRGLYDTARHYVNSVAATLSDGQLRARSLLALAQLARQQRHFERADAHLASARPLAQKHPALWTALLMEQGILAGCRGHYQTADEDFRTALQQARANGEPHLLIPLLKELGATSVARGRYDEAQHYYREAWSLAHTQHPHYVPALLNCLGGVAIVRDADYATARSYYKQALAQARTSGNHMQLAILLNNLAAVAWQAGEREAALAHLEEGLQTARQVHHEPAIAMIMGNLGRVALQDGEWKQAERCLEQALAVATKTAHRELAHSLRQSLATLANPRAGEGKEAPAGERLPIFFD